MYMSGLGVTANDLPNRGRNLRLYLHYPIGSPQATPPLVGHAGGCRTEAGCFMTGHYDSSLPGGPCSQADPQEFASWAEMSAYAGGRGESLVMVGSNDEVNSLCSAVPPPVAPTPVVSMPTLAPVSSEGQAITIHAPARQPVSLAPTGVNVPTVVYVPGAGPMIEPATTPTPATDYTPYLIGGLALLALM